MKYNYIYMYIYIYIPEILQLYRLLHCKHEQVQLITETVRCDWHLIFHSNALHAALYIYRRITKQICYLCSVQFSYDNVLQGSVSLIISIMQAIIRRIMWYIWGRVHKVNENMMS